MKDSSPGGIEGALPAALHELVDTVGVQHMTPSSVRRRVKERARRRRFRRCLGSVALASVALFLVAGASATQDHGTGDVLVTRAPLVPAAQEPAAPASVPSAAPISVPANRPPAQDTTPTTRASVDPSNRHPVTTPAPRPASPPTSPPGADPGTDGRNGVAHDAPTTRGGPADTPPRGD